MNGQKTQLDYVIEELVKHKLINLSLSEHIFKRAKELHDALLWSDKDMIDFAQRFSEYEVTLSELNDYREDIKEELLKDEINVLYDKIKDNPGLLSKIKQLVEENTL